MKSGVLARYKDFLPITAKTPLFSLGEGDTPLVRCSEIEKEIGCPVLAFSFYDLDPAKLDEEKLAKLQEYEKGKCICLLAVEQ